MAEIRIVVVDGGGAGGGVLGTDTTTGARDKKDNWRKRNKQSKLHRALNPNLKKTLIGDTTTEAGAMKLYAVNMGIGLATSTARQWVNFHMNDIGRRHGDSNYQARVNRQIERVSDIAGFGTSALQGAAAGAIFGPKGALVGAGVGAISHALGIHFRQLNRQRDYIHTMFEENNNQIVQLSRANFNLTTSRLR